MFVSEIGHDPLYAPWTKGKIGISQQQYQLSTFPRAFLNNTPIVQTNSRSLLSKESFQKL